MICPHDHQECDNRGCRYGGCQGRTTGELVVHKDPPLEEKHRRQEPEWRNRVSSYR